jgi:hypothetical protein
MSDDLVYLSKIRIEREMGPQRRAYLPHVKEPVLFGVHSEVAEYYGADPSRFEPRPTTLDFLVAATAG